MMRAQAAVLAVSVLAACGADAAPAAAGSDTGTSGLDTTAAVDGSPSSSSTGANDDATTWATTLAESSGAPASSEATGTGEPRPGFEPFACATEPPDVLVQRLCVDAADPAAAPDEVFIDCALEGSCQGPMDPPATDIVRVLAWNIARGGNIDAQLAAFAAGTLPMPDVILMSEADRGCARTGERNIAWEYAAALGMNHVYGVEFTELPRPDGSITAPCEHGNAILSRYPIGNVELIRHAVNESWYDTDEPRLGGRMALRADILVGERILHVASLHFESGAEDGPKRAAQAAELADAVLTQPHAAVVGGDTNAGLYALDLLSGTHTEATTEAFFERGFADAHLALGYSERITKPRALVLDLIFVHGADVSGSEVCAGALCDPLSDHRAVWTLVTLPEAQESGG